MKLFLATGLATRRIRGTFEVATNSRIVVSDHESEAIGAVFANFSQKYPETDGWTYSGVKATEITDTRIIEVAADLYIEMIEKEKSAKAIEPEPTSNLAYDMDPDVFHDGGRMV